ncbi:MAG: hypothetical protein QM740_08960 [Acidovorax sp.]
MTPRTLTPSLSDQLLPPIEGREALPRPPMADGWIEERLPFSVRIARDDEALSKAVQVRHAAYARHVPDLAQLLVQPEPADFADGSVVLLAESHIDGSSLGTMRIQTNRYAPLALEQSLALPQELSSSLLAEATRLGVADGQVGTLVKTVLFKAFYLYCRQAGVDWMVVAGRSPIDRQYLRLLFEDVYPGQGYIPLRHAGGLLHRVMKFDVATAEQRWAQARHPLFKFIFCTYHPDIRLDVHETADALTWTHAANAADSVGGLAGGQRIARQ